MPADAVLGVKALFVRFCLNSAALILGSGRGEGFV